MPSLQEKIESDAAKRLLLPAGRHPKDELARYKDFLKAENQRIKQEHRAGGTGKEICHARAALVDVLLSHLLQVIQEVLPPPGRQEAHPPFALVAIGGYGRGELNPYSDIDLMFLSDGEFSKLGKNSYFSQLTDGFLYTLWDLGFKIGHSVRTIDDCVKVANSNMQSKTSLIEARLVAGDKNLFDRMQTSVLARCVRGQENDYIAARLQDQAARRAKFGNSACMQEPNIKNGCGGLRDYQNLIWMAFFKYRVLNLAQLQEKEMITEQEVEQLDAAYDFLLRVRNELHYQVERAVDALPRALQPTIAHHLGYTERSPRQRLERFMGEVYRHLRNIYLITRTLEQRLALVPQPTRIPSLRLLLRKRRTAALQQVDGLKFFEGEILPASNRIFRDQPRRLMRVFLHAQQRGLRLHPDLAQLIRNQLNLVDREFLHDPHVHQTFLEILNQRGNVAPILRSMHDVGFLGKYLPEFGQLTCLVQHEFFHQYTADEHTLVCIEKLDEVWKAEKAPFSQYAELLRSLERPFILYLALLLHDAGKADPDVSHSEASRDLAMEAAKRLNLDGAMTHSLCLIIEHHLVMAQISQRRDLDDPTVIRNFAQLVQTPENLSMLTLHTFVDSLGTSDQLWNGFKDTLLWTLHCKTMAALTGRNALIRAEEMQRNLLMDEVRRSMPVEVSEEELEAHFLNLPSRYFAIHNADQILGHLTLAHRFMHLQLAEEDRALEPVMRWSSEPDRGYAAVTICTWDRAGLFSKIAGTLSALNLNILSAQIFTRSDGIILDTFFVIDGRTGLLPTKEDRDKVERLLTAVLSGEVQLGGQLANRKRSLLPYKLLEGERIATHIHIDNDTSEDYTFIEIQTEDRLGLLHAVSQILSELGIDIALAKICTEKGAAMDSFYVLGPGKKKISGPADEAKLRLRLEEAIRSLEPAAAA